MPGYVRYGRRPHDAHPEQDTADARSTRLSGPGLAVSVMGLILAAGTVSCVIEGWGVWPDAVIHPGDEMVGLGRPNGVKAFEEVVAA